MRLAIVLFAALAAGCAGSMPVPCGSTSCSAGQQCCTECGGAQRCMDSCGIPMCADAGGAGTDGGGAGTDAGGSGTDAGGSGTDAGGAGTDAGGSDAGGSGTDAGGSGTDAGGSGTDAGGSGADAGPRPPCPPGECYVRAGGDCELPTGPTGNACCECTDSVCTVPCRCLAAEAPIATPSGEVAVSELGVGDLVYTVHEDAVVVAPIVAVRRVPVTDHVVVRVRLAGGATFRASPIHPTADGRTFADLSAGDALDGVAILDAELEPYEGAFTHDILPASDTGDYFIGGVRVASTLRP